MSDVDPDTQLVGYIRAHLLLTVAISMRRGGEDAVASVLHTDCTSHQRCFIGPHDDAIRLCLPLRPAAIPGRRPRIPRVFFVTSSLFSNSARRRVGLMRSPSGSNTARGNLSLFMRARETSGKSAVVLAGVRGNCRDRLIRPRSVV